MKKLIAAVTLVGLLTMGVFANVDDKKPAAKKHVANKTATVKKEEAAAAPKHKITVNYEIGDQVKVTSGNFASFTGTVEELDFDKNRVKVSISIFGRATPLELAFEDVELVK